MKVTGPLSDGERRWIRIYVGVGTVALAVGTVGLLYKLYAWLMGAR